MNRANVNVVSPTAYVIWQRSMLRVTYYIKLHNALIFNVCVYIYIYKPIKLKLVVWTLRNMNIFP